VAESYGRRLCRLLESGFLVAVQCAPLLAQKLNPQSTAVAIDEVEADKRGIGGEPVTVPRLMSSKPMRGGLSRISWPISF
jgi:hypothetical protein